jgi:CheY-like chemotaxis protein
MSEQRRSEVVLVVDDDDDCRELARLALRRAGFRVVTSVGGRAALQALGGLRPDAVVLDVHMPEVPGPAVWEWLQLSPSHGEVAVVFWTAGGMNDDAIDGAAIVPKGGSLAVLVDAVDGALAGLRSAPAARSG